MRRWRWAGKYAGGDSEGSTSSTILVRKRVFLISGRVRKRVFLHYCGCTDCLANLFFFFVKLQVYDTSQLSRWRTSTILLTLESDEIKNWIRMILYKYSRILLGLYNKLLINAHLRKDTLVGSNIIAIVVAVLVFSVLIIGLEDVFRCWRTYGWSTLEIVPDDFVMFRRRTQVTHNYATPTNGFF